jgi:23S rRNA U2552 (ribose-2'-O)-methylase RlmE/FtsJ
LVGFARRYVKLTISRDFKKSLLLIQSYQGWLSPEADEFFRKQREHADKSSIKDERYFYGMMKRNGTKLHKETSAFYIPFASGRDPLILDMCMAPGAFLDTALKFNPFATAVACSLPTDQGGHPILMPETPRAEIHLVDITMLAADMGITTVPTDHPEANKFLPRTLPNERVFDLVICDGQVLRTHELAEYRTKGEPRRLSASQLAMGLERLRPGGTIILLLHQVEAWRSALVIYTFSKFARIMLFKPPAPTRSARHSTSSPRTCRASLPRPWRRLRGGRGFGRRRLSPMAREVWRSMTRGRPRRSLRTLARSC